MWRGRVGIAIKYLIKYILPNAAYDVRAASEVPIMDQAEHEI
jgi:hypothetical protein